MFFTFTFTTIHILMILLLFWAFRRPEEVLVPGRKKIIVLLIALLYVLFALLPFLEGKGEGLYMFFIAYPLFYAVIFRNSLRKILQPLASKWFLLFPVIFLLLWATEIPLAASYAIDGVGGYQSLFSVWKHEVFYAGFYMGIALVISLFFRYFNYSLWQVFIVGGVWGLVIEQNFLGPQLLFSRSLLEFAIFASFIFPTYGLYLAGPRLLFYEELKSERMKKAWQPLLLFMGILIVPLITWFFLTALLKLAGIETAGIL